MDGTELSIEEIEALSRLPSLDVMHSQLVGMIASPLSGLVRTLNALLSGIAIALGQIQEQGLVTGTEPEPAAAAAEPQAEAAEPEAEAAEPEAEAAEPEARAAEPEAPAADTTDEQEHSNEEGDS